MGKKRILNNYGTYHVFNRGHNKMAIFKDSQDKDVFLNLLRNGQILFNFQIFAYCLMLNHYHLLFKDVKKQLPLAIGWLQENYAIYFNAKYNHSGAVFMKPFKSKPIYLKGHFFVAVSYILNNPVKAGMVSEFNEYTWNSALTGYEKHNLTDYLYLHSYYKSIAGLSLSEYINRRSRSKKISDIELKVLTDKDAEELFINIIIELSNHSQFSSELITPKMQKEIILEAKYRGVNSRQIVKFTGISQYTISQMKICKSYI